MNAWVKHWLFTTYHKDVGLLYFFTSLFFGFIGAVLALLMRVQLSVPNNDFLDAVYYNQAVTMHGLIMIFWFLSPVGIGLANYFVPLQIGAKDLASVQAATHGFEDPTKKFLSAVAFDECRHDEVCRRACARVCPNFPYRFKPETELEKKAHRNILAMYENGRRYWSAFNGAWDKYPLELIFSSFFFAEIGAQLIFREVGERSTNKVYSTSFRNITRDESRHLTGTLAMLESIAEKMGSEDKALISRQLKHGFIYLFPLLFKPIEDFWKLPSDFFEYDQKLEELAFSAGLGVPKVEERKEAWMQAITRHRSKIEELGIRVPEIKEIGVAGLTVDVKKGDEIIATPL